MQMSFRTPLPLGSPLSGMVKGGDSVGLTLRRVASNTLDASTGEARELDLLSTALLASGRPLNSLRPACRAGLAPTAAPDKALTVNSAARQSLVHSRDLNIDARITPIQETAYGRLTGHSLLQTTSMFDRRAARTELRAANSRLRENPGVVRSPQSGRAGRLEG